MKTRGEKARPTPTMKAVVTDFPTRTTSLVELPEPTFASTTQVKVKVQRVGISNLDRAIARGLAGKAPSGGALILGHEMVGRVVQRGKAAHQLRLGDVVTATVRRGCRVCESCLQGEADLCYSGLYTERGIHEAHGFLAEYVVDEEAAFIRIPQALEGVGVLLEPLSVCIKALALVREVQRRVPPRCSHPEHAWDQPGWANCKRALIVGVGTTGLLASLLLIAGGASVYIYALEPPDSPQANLVRQAGAIDYFSAQDIPLPQLSGSIAQVDVAIEAAGDPAVPLALVPLLARNGALALLGTPEGHSQMTLNVASMLRQLVSSNQTILGCYTSNRRHYLAGAEALTRLTPEHSSWVSQLITHRYPLADFKRALARPAKGTITAVVEL